LHLGGIGGLTEFRSSRASEIKGLGTSKKAQLLALSEISRRIAESICREEEGFFPFLRIFQSLKVLMQGQVRESFYLVNFSLEGRVLRLEKISQGSLWEVGVYKRDLVKMVLEDASGSCLVIHNHPRHSARPSSEDLALFHELKRLLEELEVVLIDQWILGNDGIHSSRYPVFLEPSSWNSEKLPSEYRFLADIHTAV